MTRLQRRLEDWVGQAATERTYHRGPLQAIAAAQSDPRRTRQRSIAALLLGTWHCGAGAAAILRGDPPGGWDRLRVGAALQRAALSLRLPPNRGPNAGRTPPALPLLPTANCVALGLALDDPEGEPLRAAFAALPDGAYGPADAWPRFVRELLQLRQGRRPQLGPRLGVYEPLLQAWSAAPSVLALRLAAVLDHHLLRTRGAPGRPAEFDEPGLLLLPVEVLAVRTVRRELELPMPKVEHALCFTNLATTAPAGDWPDDPLVRDLGRRQR